MLNIIYYIMHSFLHVVDCCLTCCRPTYQIVCKTVRFTPESAAASFFLLFQSIPIGLLMFLQTNFSFLNFAFEVMGTKVSISKTGGGMSSASQVQMTPLI